LEFVPVTAQGLENHRLLPLLILVSSLPQKYQIYTKEVAEKDAGGSRDVNGTANYLWHDKMIRLAEA